MFDYDRKVCMVIVQNETNFSVKRTFEMTREVSIFSYKITFLNSIPDF
jgi:hypothetical protein